MIETKKTFGIWSLIRQGWDLFKEDMWKLFGLVVGLLALYIVILGLIYFIFPDQETAPWYMQVANQILGLIVALLFEIGVIHTTLRVVDRKPVSFGEFFAKTNLLPKFILAYLLVLACIFGIIVVLGIPFLILLGVYGDSVPNYALITLAILAVIALFFLVIRLSFLFYYIVDKDSSPWQALKQSWNTIKGVSWRFLGFMLALTLLNIIGLLCLGVGFLFTLPVSLLAMALLYRKLSGTSAPQAIADSI